MSTVLRTPIFRAPPPLQSSISLKPQRVFCVSFRHGGRGGGPKPYRLHNSLPFSHTFTRRFGRFIPFASQQEEATETDPVHRESEDDSDTVINGEDTLSESDSSSSDEELPVSAVAAALQAYKEALENNDDSKLGEIEAFIKSIEDEKTDLEKKVATLSKENSHEKNRTIRISADFDNFRKRTEKERFSLISNAQGELIESLLPVLDNFERAKTQIKLETEGEEKINNSYQSIYKQFIEILDSLGVDPVETTGTLFDPLLHEAIMREESTEFEEGIVLQEFRKGFKLGDRLLRPSMVKVSAGPGPARREQSEETDDAGSSKPESLEQSEEAGVDDINEEAGESGVSEQGVPEVET